MMLTRAEEQFRALASEVLRKTDLERLTWRHHGLGMLQGEINYNLRVHIWHPKLRTIPTEGFRDVHDHRFDLTSFVAYGVLLDIGYLVDFESTKPNADAFEIVHAKKQDQVATVAKKIGAVRVEIERTSYYRAGDVYGIARRDFHTTRVEDLAVTLIHRGHFDTGDARILGYGASAIVPETNETKATKQGIVWRAVDALRDTL